MYCREHCLSQAVLLVDERESRVEGKRNPGSQTSIQITLGGGPGASGTGNLRAPQLPGHRQGRADRSASGCGL